MSMRSPAPRPGDDADAAALWAGSGAMALTGHARGAPAVAPASLAVAAARAAEALRALAAAGGAALALDGAALLGERAACAGLARNGRVSAGGRARIVRSADGWLAVNLPRADDVASLPAWLECGAVAPADPWPAIERRVRERCGGEWVERARWLGLAIAEVEAPGPAPHEPVRCVPLGSARAPDARPLVVDLSSLWAGPLCAQLLGAAGARVVKVESAGRPDGARFGPPAFFELLNGGKESVALDLSTPDGVASLRRLIGAADVVIESARPRALRQLGIDAEAEVAARPGLVWVSITGYGREGQGAERIAFGDDAACAAGLAWLAGRDDGGPIFCADAVADPLAGLFAAVAALGAWRRGGGVLLDVALRTVAAHALSFAAPPARWQGPVAPPRARPVARRARPLGADTRAVLGALSG
jgi:hypothetical protein